MDMPPITRAEGKKIAILFIFVAVLQEENCVLMNKQSYWALASGLFFSPSIVCVPEQFWSHFDEGKQIGKFEVVEKRIRSIGG